MVENILSKIKGDHMPSLDMFKLENRMKGLIQDSISPLMQQ